MTIEELQRQLDIIRAWRKIELSNARSIAERHQASAEIPYLCRAWTLMIYAHCDQALKLIAKAYLEFLSCNPRQNYDYKNVWLSFFGKEAMRKGGDERFSMCRNDSDEIRRRIISNINGREVFDSGSFSYTQLRFFTEWILQSSFDHTLYRGFCTTLKEKRDGIAHGENIIIENVSDCLAWHDPAINLLDDLVDSTINEATRH
ncbi:MAE_28990/MAE_18760 family HEPN-like nuclease [Paenirhodobacter populi]|uniref:MAE_28990/MAE_18760 family HEPN-like nuclease n=1 Tax=Paenirhodobacter populi TaxID=2306993 RepID=UPI000FE325CF|nr:MAE_28990/MAE_18760 family HEPN-like nuclease [Sinirhodobacter populi]RWR09694.1 hypothetical protein D2T32_04950 [Sinirhodobacter populi]